MCSSDLIKAFGDSEAEAPRPTEKVVAFPQKAAAETAPVEAPPPVARAVEEAVPPATLPEAAAATEEPAANMTADAETTMDSPAMAAEPVALIAEAIDVTIEVAGPSPEVADVIAEAADPSPEAADAHDDAVLDMVAMEMAAPDPEDAYDPPESEAYESQAGDEAPTSYETQVSSELEPQVSYEPQATALPPAAPFSAAAERPEPVVAAAPQPAQEPKSEPEPSLGSSLIASGLVRGHAASRPDPLAAIRRMSQAEKIALFS